VNELDELDELRRRLVAASPEFPAVSPGAIRDRVRRRRRVTGVAAVLAVAVLAGGAVVGPRLLLDRPRVPTATMPTAMPTATPTATPAPAPRTAPARACPTRSPKDDSEIVDYADVVRLGGRDYLSAGEQAGRPVRAARLGTVLCTITVIRPGSGYLLQDGDATYLPAGTVFYSVRGLPSRFRVVTQKGRIYDSRDAPDARRGGDLLPLTGAVASIELVGTDGGIRRLTDPAAVTAAVDGIVAAPAHPDPDWPGYTGELRFRLRDGTTVVRQWDPGRRLIIGAIQLPASVVALLDSAR
jgi:hypothetical protein